jgi:hypothetical protein
MCFASYTSQPNLDPQCPGPGSRLNQPLLTFSTIASSPSCTRLLMTSPWTCPASLQPGVTSSWYIARGKRVRRVFKWNRVERLMIYLH